MEAKRAIVGATTTTAVLVVAMFGYSRWTQPAPRHAARAMAASSSAPADAARLRAELSVMRQEVQLVRAQLAGLQDRVGSVEKTPATEARPVADAAPDEPAIASPNPARDNEPRDLNLIEAQYMSLLDAEPVDAAWAVPEQRAIRDFVARTAPDAQIEEVECRSNLCRLRVRLPSETALSNFRYQIGQPPLDHGGFFHIDPESHTLSYFSPRAGSKLPDVED